MPQRRILHGHFVEALSVAWALHETRKSPCTDSPRPAMPSCVQLLLWLRHGLTMSWRPPSCAHAGAAACPPPVTRKWCLLCCAPSTASCTTSYAHPAHRCSAWKCCGAQGKPSHISILWPCLGRCRLLSLASITQWIAFNSCKWYQITISRRFQVKSGQSAVDQADQEGDQQSRASRDSHGTYAAMLSAQDNDTHAMQRSLTQGDA